MNFKKMISVNMIKKEFASTDWERNKNVLVSVQTSINWWEKRKQNRVEILGFGHLANREICL